MIDYTNCNIERLSVHRVGNKTNGEELRCSKNPLEISDLNLRELLISYFLKPFTTPEFYNFTFSNGDFNLNPIFNFASSIFEDPTSVHNSSVNIAKQLFEVYIHPNIKPGDLFVVKFSNIHLEGSNTETLGIFKSENRHSFLKLDNQTDEFHLTYEDGINIDKLDKGCLIFNVDKEEGFKVCIVDKSNKSIEAQYWKDTFLHLKPCNDNYHSTREFLNITKQYLTTQVSEDFEIHKADKIDLLNKSVEYFKSHDSFDKEEFENDVFNNNELIESFRNFDGQYRENNDISIQDNFEISSQAVKKQSRGFKSVLKLDKNFHIYIHGDKNKIEQGIESDGRKFYKIYYTHEQ